MEEEQINPPLPALQSLLPLPSHTRTRIKFCGMTRREDVLHAVALGVDAIGMVFYPASPRYVSPEQARALADVIPPFVAVVGLFVNAEPDFVQQVARCVPLSMLQFHGDATIDTPQRCKALAQAVCLPWLRAVPIGTNTDSGDLLAAQRAYSSSDWPDSGAGNLLLDTRTESYGGSGKVFNWSIIPRELAPQAVLSGGLSAQNVRDAVRQVRPYAVDVSSGIEAIGVDGFLKKGVKDHAAMTAFVRAVRAADAN